MKIMGRRTPVFAIGMLIALSQLSLSLLATGQTQPASRVEARTLRGETLAHNLIGTNPVRQLGVYLPPGYDGSTHRYPVIYYLQQPYNASFLEQQARKVLDRAIQTGAISPIILVSVDMSTPIGCSWYVNSPVTGNWEDFMVREVVPYIDTNFRTLPTRDSRGIAGDFMGGYGAIRFGMTHPEIFGSVYAQHPVGTGSGIYTMYSRPDWEKMAAAQSAKDVLPNGAIFLSIYQASVPDVNRPPLYIDLQAHKSGDTLTIDSAVTERVRDNFLLETMIGKYADNLKSLRGFRFDWARSDGNHDHVFANQAFTHKLNEYGIVHESEEYNGIWGSANWGIDGRVTTEVLPFFQRTLAFENNPKSSQGS